MARRVEIVLCAVIALPSIAHAQFSLVATQLGLKDEASGRSYTATCAKDACRVTLPLMVAGIYCVLNIRASAPSTAGWGGLVFALGPCERGFQVKLAAGDSMSSRYQLDPFGAMSKVYFLPYGPPFFSFSGNGMDDGVARPSAMIRLDLIATQPR